MMIADFQLAMDSIVGEGRSLHSVLGDWFRDWKQLQAFSESFKNSEPFPHVIIDGFFSEAFASSLLDNFPLPHKTNELIEWHKYENPLECKFATNDVNPLPQELREAIETLQSTEFVHIAEKISLHFHPPGGKLNVHLDYSKHPKLDKERRLNLIVYLNREWRDSFGGHLYLYSSDTNNTPERAEAKILPVFNRAVLFRTSDISWHGMPNLITCPMDDGRKSIAVYYLSNLRMDAETRLKARFVAKDDISLDPGIAEELCKIRSHRLLDAETISKVIPNWISPMRHYSDLFVNSSSTKDNVNQ
ncbi:uncharacterized protein Gasu_16310 [Galdieria sulphuraria]|uniref:Prolyl 4-hydroxylase alpha subunit Fe(2+) 2OG dioxygenase domain-containing protein n=1 Tax=Galdieria sulphuraria TaxID=130081 RepID=M2Y5K4_GALSU|nr:uncharacterized protein Gasu_16310 [Galdieria sulphuraria]EME31134.1 hypothetical protein Gasu_16310 [Galdieria sulphuraria]|eukprot:XP_005707654.1 hypothetical protein Gasu_16310 [Galdieria sulphuraria]